MSLGTVTKLMWIAAGAALALLFYLSRFISDVQDQPFNAMQRNFRFVPDAIIVC